MLVCLTRPASTLDHQITLYVATQYLNPDKQKNQKTKKKKPLFYSRQRISFRTFPNGRPHVVVLSKIASVASYVSLILAT